MTFLVVEGSAGIRDTLCYMLLSFGIKGIPVSSASAALEVIRKGDPVDGAIVDVDAPDVDGVRFIQELKENPQTQSIRVIIHTFQSQKEFVVKMVELGVLGYLLKPFNEEETASNLRRILEKTTSASESRRHVRVRPDPGELLRLYFKLSDHPGLISGKVLDISMGGVAVEMFQPPPENVLKPKRFIPKVQFSLGSHTLIPSAQVVMVRGKFLALRFDSMRSPDRAALARYIFKRMSM